MIMKKRNLLLGSIGVAAVAAALLVSPIFENIESETSYTPGDISKTVKGAKGAKEYYDYIHTNPETGELMTEEDFFRQKESLAALRQNRSTVFSWTEMGPSNIGGRTRSICIDNSNRYHLLAGSVTGGLWQSFDAANTWSQVEAYNGDFHINTITQTADGTYYVGTGMSYGGFEGYPGDGIHKSTDGGVTWTQMSGASGSDFSVVQELASNQVDNTLWIGDFNQGLWKSVDGADPVEVSGTNGLPSQGVSALSVSKDGQVIIAGVKNSTNRLTYVSQDGGSTWTDYSDAGETANPIRKSGVNRVEYSISDKKVDGKYYIYAVFSASSSHFGGAWVSDDNGVNWDETAPLVTTAQVNDNLSELFNPVAAGNSPQGAYNMLVAATPWDATGCFIGGLDVYRWKQQISDPIFGDFKQVSQWSVSPTSNSYVHADNHDVKFDIYNRMYIANDGGVGVCDQPVAGFDSGFGLEFIPANRNYNVTQFYDVSFSGEGDVIGGTQDNGSLYNDHASPAYGDFKEVLGGDGFDADISAFNPRVMFASSQYGNCHRSSDQGVTMNDFYPNYPGSYGAPGAQGGVFPFYTKLRLAEYFDLNSQDSVKFIATQNYASGDALRIPSLSTGDSMDITAPFDLVYQDTVFYDPSLDVVEYIVRDSVSQSYYDLGLLAYSDADFVTTSDPVLRGDTIDVSLESGGTVEVIIDSIINYNYHYGEHPTDAGRLLPMHIKELLVGVAWDTLTVQDPYQSWYATTTNANGGEIWVTRDALRFSSANPQWAKIAEGVGNVNEINFAKDLSKMYISTSGGLKVYDGLDLIYSQDPDFVDKVTFDSGINAVNEITSFTGLVNSSINSVAIDYFNPDRIFVARSSGAIYECNNATNTVSLSFTSNGSVGSGVVVHDIELAKDVSNGGSGNSYLLAGTDEGVFINDLVSSSWEDCSEGFGKVPVYAIKYAWRTWDEGNDYYGAVYIGTHGRGIFRSTSFLSLPDDADYLSFDEGVKTDLTVFPNPVDNSGSLGFVLSNNELVEVEIYNLSGRLVKRIAKQQMQKGQNQINMDVSDLNAGTYIVKMIAGANSDVTKFVKSK
jgi:hypothetical protein